MSLLLGQILLLSLSLALYKIRNKKNPYHKITMVIARVSDLVFAQKVVSDMVLILDGNSLNVAHA